MPLRIRHIVCLAPPRLGGMGAAALRWAEGLQERGLEVELVVPEVFSAAPSHPLIHAWPTHLVWGNGAILKSLSHIWEDVDVVHLHYPFYGVAEALLFKRPPKPVVVTFHMDAEPKGWRQPIIMAQRAWLQDRLLRHASRLLVSSFDYLAHSSAASLYQQDPAKWEELPFFVDDTVFVPAAKPPSDQLRVLFVGVLDRAHLFKGIHEALEAMTRTVDMSLTIVGDGDQRAYLEQEVRAKGLSDRVSFLGRLSPEALVHAYQSADVLLFPSTSRAEAFGLVALEAQACGTPVIASALPGVRTVVKDGETGILVTPGSIEEIVAALRRMQDQPAWRLELGKQARAHIESTYRRADLLDRQIAIYERLCASR